MVLLGTVTAVSACTPTIDVKPYSCPNPLNLKNNGVVTVAVDGSGLIKNFENKFNGNVEELGFKVLKVYLQKSSNGETYELDFDTNRVVFEDVRIAPCCDDKYVDKDNVPDVLIKIKDLNYNPAHNDGRSLPEGEYNLYIRYMVDDSIYKWSSYTMSDCVRIMY